jgi:hypothetical protein
MEESPPQPNNPPQPLANILHTPNNRLPALRHLRRDVPAPFILPLSLRSVNALTGECVADGSREAVLSDLVGDEVVDAVLEGVGLGVGGEFGFGEVFWVWGGRVSEGWGWE